MALTIGPLHSPSVSSSSSWSKPCLLPGCRVLEYLISLLRAPVWQQLEQVGRTCLLFVLGQAEHGAGRLPRFPSELRCRAVSSGTLGPS